MVALAALWMPIVVSAVFVLVALAIVHGALRWHQGDMAALPGEARILETMRALGVPPGDYRFPHGTTVAEMEAPEFVAKMTQGPVGVVSIRPNGELNMGKMFGQWLVYSLVIAVLAAYVTGRAYARGAPFGDVFRVSGVVAFCCYVVALWNDWIWWGKSTRLVVTYSLDGVIYALVTGATFGWLWPR